MWTSDRYWKVKGQHREDNNIATDLLYYAIIEQYLAKFRV